MVVDLLASALPELDRKPMKYCVIHAAGVEHVVFHLDFGGRWMCGRKVFVLPALVQFQAAARKATARW